ncbi:hypothetical protein [Streptomyces olivaceoviridis]|uniref:hypothetical protein n=1 Tax=Streptomyces olivaceoviridis TaxID=1921 RepID=UPI00368776A2
MFHGNAVIADRAPALAAAMIDGHEQDRAGPAAPGGLHVPGAGVVAPTARGEAAQ